jgi:hypothetical protein
MLGFKAALPPEPALCHLTGSQPKAAHAPRQRLFLPTTPAQMEFVKYGKAVLYSDNLFREILLTFSFEKVGAQLIFLQQWCGSSHRRMF